MRGGKQIGRHDHHQRRPRLLAEEGDAEQHDREVGGRMRDENDDRHHRRARAERDFSRHVSSDRPRWSSQLENQPPQRLPRPTPRMGSTRSSPPVSRRSRARRRGTSAARTIEVPGSIAQELAEHQPPDLNERQQPDPGHGTAVAAIALGQDLGSSSRSLRQRRVTAG